MARQYALVDCARAPELIWLVKSSAAHACLFAGALSPDVEAVSPFLVDLDANQALSHAWRERGWGAAWGVLFRSEADLETLRRHFRHFLLAQLPSGDKVMFRFFDPRVLRSFLPTCTSGELAQWFAHVGAFVMETELGAPATFRFDGASLAVIAGGST